MKHCVKCEKEKTISEFYYNKRFKKLNSWCKECGKKRAAEGRAKLRQSVTPSDILKVRLYDLLCGCRTRGKNNKRWGSTITYKEVKSLYEAQNGKCFYTGETMNISRENSYDLFGISLDRIDSSKGYVTGNVVLCCWGMNALKGQKSATEMMVALRRFYESSKKNGKF